MQLLRALQRIPANGSIERGKVFQESHQLPWKSSTIRLCVLVVITCCFFSVDCQGGMEDIQMDFDRSDGFRKTDVTSQPKHPRPSHDKGYSDFPASPIPHIILDCDPAGLIASGLDVDDDLALINALSLHRKGEIQILGLTITGGNAPLPLTFLDALEVVRRRAGIPENEIGIYQGGRAFGSFLDDFNATNRTVNQENEMEGTKFFSHFENESSSEATKFLIKTIMNAPKHTVTVLCIGPLTNIALAYAIEPRIAGRVKQIVTMAGTITPGVPLDLNVRKDPHAAAIVLNEMPCHKILVPVETCIQAVFGRPQQEKVRDYCKTDESAPEQPPVICSFLFRLAGQIRVMPWVVNWRYKPREHSTIETSQHLSDGFILWDLAALWALVRPDLYDDWGYFNVTLHPPSQSGGPTEFTSNPFPSNYAQIAGLEVCRPSNNPSTCEENRNKVLVPQTLKDEGELHDLILEHLLYPSSENVNSVEPFLTFRQRLGALPRILAGLVLVPCGVASLVQLVFKIILPKRSIGSI